MRLLVDTGVFSAGLRPQPPAAHRPVLTRMVGHQIFLAVHTVAELRFGALAAEWGDARRDRLEGAIAATTVVPVSDALLHRVARLRLQCRRVGHPLADRVHTADLWIAASALHVGAAVLTLDQVFGVVPDLVLTYFKTNVHRMRYAHFRSLGMFVGSGAVEAGCKAVVGQRLKLSGMRWSQPGATGILALRCQYASPTRHQIWPRQHNQTQAVDLAARAS